MNWSVHGTHNSVTKEIKYHKDTVKSEIADTLIHETLHAVVQMMQLFDDKEQEEKIVAGVAAGLTTVFKDNPKFLKAIQELLKS